MDFGQDPRIFAHLPRFRRTSSGRMVEIGGYGQIIEIDNLPPLPVSDYASERRAREPKTQTLEKGRATTERDVSPGASKTAEKMYSHPHQEYFRSDASSGPAGEERPTSSRDITLERNGHSPGHSSNSTVKADNITKTRGPLSNNYPVFKPKDWRARRPRAIFRYGRKEDVTKRADPPMPREMEENKQNSSSDNQPYGHDVRRKHIRWADELDKKP